MESGYESDNEYLESVVPGFITLSTTVKGFTV